MITLQMVGATTAFCQEWITITEGKEARYDGRAGTRELWRRFSLCLYGTGRIWMDAVGIMPVRWMIDWISDLFNNATIS